MIAPGYLFSQSKAAASASVTIVTSAVGIAANNDTSPSGITIKSPYVQPSIFFQNDISIKQVPGTYEKVKIASFKLIGSSYAYDITLPISGIFPINRSGLTTIKLSSFTAINTASSSTLDIFATPELDSSIAEGTYKAITPVNIVVNYN